jgi:hypothetical protein
MRAGEGPNRLWPLPAVSAPDCSIVLVGVAHFPAPGTLYQIVAADRVSQTRRALAMRLKRADDIQRLCRLLCLFLFGRLMLKLANGVFYIPSHRRRKTSIGEHLLEPQEPAFLPGLFY